uniref:Cytochrome c oxidase subunit 2 n=1 Tax=Cyanoptyche gloeocystis TaxID=77922 RepID=A0A096Y6W6_9EUKA|nr:cytochrome c oxidase subunit 2 [Cyanoptyche gloeocystis]AIM52080.1 cytochrome c oxidase subunit 2 [Cyanoptyche gloeocystis]
MSTTYYIMILFFIILTKNNINFCERAEPWQILFQDSASPSMEGIINLHHDLMFFLIFIACFVLWILTRAVVMFSANNNKIPSSVTHGTFIEIVWTLAPTIILLLVAIPSFALLYSIDEIIDPSLTLKVIGHQWYWSYEYSDDFLLTDKNVSFDSYMILEEDLELGQLRLLEVDNKIVLPINTQIRIIVTSADVIHSWAVPSLGIKCDAIPGRLNQVGLYIKRPGTFYGQCSEICGVNHAFMPIAVEGVNIETFFKWWLNKQEISSKEYNVSKTTCKLPANFYTNK